MWAGEWAGRARALRLRCRSQWQHQQLKCSERLTLAHLSAVQPSPSHTYAHKQECPAIPPPRPLPSSHAQVADSVKPAPRHCLVSASTRRALSGWRHERLSQSKCKEIFDLRKGDLSGLHFVWEARSAFAGKVRGGHLAGPGGWVAVATAAAAFVTIRLGRGCVCRAPGPCADSSPSCHRCGRCRCTC